MATELINIRVYNSTGDIDTTWSPVVSIFDVDLNTYVVSSAAMSHNITVGRYQYLFTTFDDTHRYLCDVYFGASALTKYVSFSIWRTSSLTDAEAAHLANTFTMDNVLLDTWDVIIPI